MYTSFFSSDVDTTTWFPFFPLRHRDMQPIQILPLLLLCPSAHYYILWAWCVCSESVSTINNSGWCLSLHVLRTSPRGTANGTLPPAKVWRFSLEATNKRTIRRAMNKQLMNCSSPPLLTYFCCCCCCCCTTSLRQHCWVALLFASLPLAREWCQSR